MARYCYAALISRDADGFNVTFPDFESCYTSGATQVEAIYMASDVLALTLVDMEDNGETMPKPTEIKGIVCGENETATLVVADTVSYRKKVNGKAIKKTLTLPQWLNEAAEAKNVNFSQILQEALTERLGIV